MNTMTASEIIGALKATGKDRKWLASVLGVKPSTVDNWLSRNRAIPAVKQAQIVQALSQKDDAPASVQSYKDVIALALRFTAEEWEVLQKSLPAGVDIEAWARHYVLHVLPNEASGTPAPASYGGEAMKPFA